MGVAEDWGCCISTLWLASSPLIMANTAVCSGSDASRGGADALPASVCGQAGVCPLHGGHQPGHPDRRRLLYLRPGDTFASDPDQPSAP